MGIMKRRSSLLPVKKKYEEDRKDDVNKGVNHKDFLHLVASIFGHLLDGSVC